MKLLNADISLESFWQRLSSSNNPVLVLDYDGTLAPFSVERDKAVPYSGIRDILADILSLPKCRVVIVTGRSATDIPPLLAVHPLPEIWGTHGRERLNKNGSHELLPVPLELKQIIDGLYNWLISEGYEKQAELKSGCLAFHTRGMDEDAAKRFLSEIKEKWHEIERCTSGEVLNLRPFDGGIELRARGVDKGKAVEIILKESGIDTAVAYLGDDLTDEDAFRAIKGKGLGVLVRQECRETAADIWLQPPTELIEFLLQWKEICRRQRI